MAARTATKTGNWSDTSVWDGGASLPGSGDTADSNGYTVTINQDVDLSPGGALINTNSGAGGFACSTARTIAADITATVGTVLTLTNGSGVTVTIIGDVTGGSADNVYGINKSSGSGGIAITGDITGGTANGAHGLYTAGGISGGEIVVVGTVTSGGSGAQSGIYHLSTDTLSVTGNVYGGRSYGLANMGTATITITGDCYGPSGYGVGAYNSIGGRIDIIGNVYGGGAGNTYGVRNNSSGTVTISGSATGGSDPTAYGAYNYSSGTLTVGQAIGGTKAPGLYGNQSSGTTSYITATDATNKVVAIGGFVTMAYDQDVNYIRVIRSDTGDALDLSNDYPAAADVKKNVVYKLGGETGTYDPTASAVYPAEANVLEVESAYGPTGDEYAGAYHAPDAAEVISTAVFGPNSETSGTVVQASTGDVEAGVTYGPGSALTGTFVVPAEEDVKSGVEYGNAAEFTGALVGGTDWTDAEKQQIRQALGITGDTAATTGAGVLDAILADTSTDGVLLAATQGAITWGQQKITASKAGEGALHITNSGTGGYGAYVADTQSSGTGVYATGGSRGALIMGTNATGIGVGITGGTANGQGMVVTGDYGITVVGTTADVVGDITGNVSGSVGSVTDVSGITDAVWDEAIADHLTAGTTGLALHTAGSAAGTGTMTFTYTLTSSVDGTAIEGAIVEVYSDSTMSSLVATGLTNSAGQVVFYLDAGTYYLKRIKPGWSFTNPDQETVA